MNAVTTKTHDHSSGAPNVKIIINKVGMDRPKAWLAAGMEDFRRATAVSLSYGMFWVGCLSGHWWPLVPMALALPLSADVPRTWAMRLVAGGPMLGNLP